MLKLLEVVLIVFFCTSVVICFIGAVFFNLFDETDDDEQTE